MRFNPFSTLLTALVLSAALASPAQAQRQSLAERLAALEQRAANDRGNLDLLNQVGELRTEVQTLRALVEELQNANQQLKQTNKDQYLDLDGRLNRLEGGAAPASVPGVPAPAPPPAVSLPEPSSAPAPVSDGPAPTVRGDVGAMADAGQERAAYGVAFEALKAGTYADAAQLFLSFLELYPNGAYAPNALYWLGESYYVTQNYTLAAQQFRSLLERHPTHDKAPGALLKLGLSEFGEGKVQAAEATLAEVTVRYPGSDAARTAADRLRSIQVGRLR